MQYAFIYLTLMMLAISATGGIVLVSYVLTERRASLLEGFLCGLLAPTGMLALTHYLVQPSPLPMAVGAMLMAALLGAMALTHRPVRTI